MCLGIPGQIIVIKDEQNNIATVDIAGVQRDVNISCIVSESCPPASCVGDWVLVHVGFAMSRIDPEEARITLELLAELGEFQEELAAIEASGR